MLKSTSVFSSDFSGLPCLVQLCTSYICRIAANIGILKDGSLLINIFASNNCFSDRTSSKIPSTVCQKQMTPFDQKLNVSSCSDYLIMFKFG